MAMPNKTFDCVQMKRDIQDRIARETDGMTPEQRLDYFRRGAEQFARKAGWGARAENPRTDGSSVQSKLAG